MRRAPPGRRCHHITAAAVLPSPPKHTHPLTPTHAHPHTHPTHTQSSQPHAPTHARAHTRAHSYARIRTHTHARTQAHARTAVHHLCTTLFPPGWRTPPNAMPRPRPTDALAQRLPTTRTNEATSCEHAGLRSLDGKAVTTGGSADAFSSAGECVWLYCRARGRIYMCAVA